MLYFISSGGVLGHNIGRSRNKATAERKSSSVLFIDLLPLVRYFLMQTYFHIKYTAEYTKETPLKALLEAKSCPIV